MKKASFFLLLFTSIQIQNTQEGGPRKQTKQSEYRKQRNTHMKVQLGSEDTGGGEQQPHHYILPLLLNKQTTYNTNVLYL